MVLVPIERFYLQVLHFQHFTLISALEDIPFKLSNKDNPSLFPTRHQPTMKALFINFDMLP